jgi:hypothetical protein
MTIHIKTQEILDAFEVYDNAGKYDDLKRNNKLLRYMMDRTKMPSFNPYKKVITGKKSVGVKGETKDIVKNKRLKREDLTTEQLAELEQMTELMDGDIGGRDKGHELKAAILRQPPVIRDQLLIIAIMIYLLRHRGADFNTEKKAFGEFYYNYRDIVLARMS